VIAIEPILVKLSTIYLDQKSITRTNQVGPASTSERDHEVGTKLRTTLLDDGNLPPGWMSHSRSRWTARVSA
jgi:ATP sulfurylase